MRRVTLRIRQVTLIIGLVLLGLLAAASGGPGEGESTQARPSEANAKFGPQPARMCFIAKWKISLEYADDEYSGAVYENDDADCLGLEFVRTSNTEPNGKYIYEASELIPSHWFPCRDLILMDKPPLVVDSAPDDFAEQICVKRPELFGSDGKKIKLDRN